MKSKTFSFLILLCFLPLIIIASLHSKVIKNPYSYLPKPPIAIDTIVSPDKAVYERGEVISFEVLAKLDTLESDPLCNYLVYIGNLRSLLTQSELIDSAVQDNYILNNESHIVLISFKVKMLNKYSPPVIAIKTIREAPGNSSVKKQFLSIAIDEYAEHIITSPSYAKVRQSGYGDTGY